MVLRLIGWHTFRSLKSGCNNPVIVYRRVESLSVETLANNRRAGAPLVPWQSIVDLSRIQMADYGAELETPTALSCWF